MRERKTKEIMKGKEKDREEVMESDRGRGRDKDRENIKKMIK